MTKPLPNYVHAGGQRCGSTWIYNALAEHPDIFMPKKEPVNYFDAQYYRGEDWYRGLYSDHDGEKVLGDESPGYIKNPLSPKRIAETIPDAKITMCLRNPVERAYSQWWTAENAWTDTAFERSLKRHSTNDAFITPGFYDLHISRWERYFDSDQIKILFFDDFKEDNKSFIQDIYRFLEVDDSFVPGVVGTKVQSNTKKGGPNKSVNTEQKIVNAGMLAPQPVKDKVLWPVYRKYIQSDFNLPSIKDPRKKYKRGDISPQVRKALEKTYYEDVKRLEDRTGRDLSHWFEHLK